MNWGDCQSWPDFSHSLEAPRMPTQPCNIFTTGRARPQSMALSVLVTMEMLKALSAVSLDGSMFRIPPWRNPWLLLGVTVAVLFGTIYTAVREALNGDTIVVEPIYFNRVMVPIRLMLLALIGVGPMMTRWMR